MDDININFKIEGNGMPLVIINGSMQTVEIWESYKDQYGLNLLFNNCTIINYDQRNQGKSSFSQNFLFSEHLLDLYKLLNKIGFEKYNILGISTGSDIAINFTLKYPELVDKLIIAGISNIYCPLQHALVLKLLLNIIEERKQEGLKDFFLLSYIYMFGSKTIEKQKNFYKLRMDFFQANSHWENYYYYIKALYDYLINLSKNKVSLNINQIKSKTLIMCGSQDFLLPLEYAYELNKNIIDSKLIIYNDSGHFFLLDHLEKIQDDIINFLYE